MQPTQVARTVISSGVQSQESFGVHFGNEAHLLRILRDQLYSNKILAVLREYGANAWDEHRECGKGDVPIKVVLPTDLEAAVVIEDFGRGLSEEDVYTVFVKYGASTKRGSNNAVGMLGIGAKSGFAYNDSFSVTSRNGGTEKIFSAVLDESDKGIMSKLYSSSPRDKVLEFAAAEKLTVSSDLDDGDEMLSLDIFDGYRKTEFAHTSVVSAEDKALLQDLEQQIQFMGGMWALKSLLATHPIMREHPDLKVSVEPSQRDRFEDWVAANSPDFKTGVAVKIPVVPKDLNKFRYAAKTLFPFFQPVPDINMPCEPIAEDRKSNGFLTTKVMEGLPPWIAVMGCVPYRLNFDVLKEELEQSQSTQLVNTLRGGLYFEIGEVDIAATREDLEYNERTRNRIMEKLEALHEELLTGFEELLKSFKGTPFALHLAALEYVRKTQLPLPRKYYEQFLREKVFYTGEAIRDKNGDLVSGKDGYTIRDFPTTFRLMRRNRTWSRRAYRYSLEEQRRFSVRPTLNFLIHNTLGKSSGGYDVSEDTVWVSMRGKATVKDVKEELTALIEAKGLAGVPIRLTEDLEYVPTTGYRGASNKKHSRTVFLYDSSSYGYTGSDHWKITSEYPGPDDPYVILNRFVPDTPLGSQYTDLIKVMRDLFGAEAPPVFGIKSTETKPVHREDIHAIPFSEWVTITLSDLIGQTPSLKDRLDLRGGVRVYEQSRPTPGAQEFLLKNLKEDHPIYRWVHAGRDLVARYKLPLPEEQKNAFDTLDGNIELVKGPYYEHLTRGLSYLRQTYPLIWATSYHGLSVFDYPDYQAHWLHYVRLVDAERGRK